MSEETTPAAADDDVEALSSALLVTESVVDGVRADQAHLPTPCPKYDVAQLRDHVVGFARNFADRATGVEPAADPATATTDEHGAVFRDAAARLVDGYRAGPGDEAVPIGVVLMEVVTHGWDLAKATGQPAPYQPDSVYAALRAGRQMMSPRFRGEGMPFGNEVAVSSSAPALDQLVAFLGRDPGWSGSAPQR